MLPFIDPPFVWLSRIIGASKDELKLIFCILLSYPFAGVLKRLPDAEPWKKNVFCISVSLFYLVGIFDLWDGIQTLLISAVGAYMIAAYVKGPYMPWIGFVYLMGHMLFSHIYRELFPQPGVVDVTGAQMVLVMKLTAFCWSVHDGKLPAEGLSPFQKDRRIVQLPMPLDYAAYVFFFPSLLAGPAFDFNEFERWISCQMFDVAAPGDKHGGTKRRRKIPKSHKPASWKALEGIAWILTYTKLSSIYSTEFMLGDKFMLYSFPRRLWFIYMFGLTTRSKYYGVWTLTDGACILSGLGYNGVDSNGRARWDRVTNIHPHELEVAQNSRAFLENWNVNTNNWLRNYVYLRVTPKGKKPGFRSSMATFGTSAVWHGISPGYYLAFVSASFLQTVSKNIRRNIRPLFLTPDGKGNGKYKSLYDTVGIFATHIAWSYTVAPFVILGLADSIKLWSRLYFYVHIGIVVCLVFFNSPGKAWLVSRQKKRVGRQVPERTNSREYIHASKMGPLGVPDAEDDLEEIRTELEALAAARRRQKK